MLDALQQEIRLRSGYLDDLPLHSIYLGGGTPSLLTAEELNTLFQTIRAYVTVEPGAEITLEANPDDLTAEKISQLRDTPVNRLSIGIQSFYDDELRYMHRAHNVAEGLRALEAVSAAGFTSWTMDLIYGTPQLTEQRWAESLYRVTDLGAPHLSAYQLTVEPKTALAHQIRQGTSPAPDDNATAQQFGVLMDWAEHSGYDHYEISNLARPGKRAVHNSAYWQGSPYLGIGPSAHSFNGLRREWNISNNALYINSIANGSAREGFEVLTSDERYNEYVMTGLRTLEGIHSAELNTIGKEYAMHVTAGVQPFVDEGYVLKTASGWALTRSGRFIADKIASELFVVRE